MILLCTSILALSAGAIGTTWLRVALGGRGRPTASADAIVVFGAEATVCGPSAELQARLDHAAELYFDGRAGTILCSGGFTGRVSEARAMRAALVRRGVAEDAVLADESGSSTRRTVASAVRHGAGRWRRVLVVSSPYHMHRIVAEARRQDLTVLPSPAPATPIMRTTLGRLRQTLREVVAVWFYALLPHAQR